MELPKLEYLRQIERGEILVRAVQQPGKGMSFQATGGHFLLRLHEDAGFVKSAMTATWAGYPERLRNPGLPAQLTDKGRAALAE